MSLRIKPHTVTIHRIGVAVAVDGTVEDPVHYDGVEVRGKVEQLTPEAAFRAFGVETVRPYRLMVDLGEQIDVNALVTWGGKRLRVAGPPRDFDAVAATAHTSVLLEEETVA